MVLWIPRGATLCAVMTEKQLLDAIEDMSP